MLTQPKYIAKIGTIDGERVVLYTAGSGSHCYAIPCEVAEGDEAGETVKHVITLVSKKDNKNDIQATTMQLIREVFGYKDAEFDAFWLPDQSAAGKLDDVRFEIVGEVEEGDKGGKYWKVKWLNPLGGGMKMPEPLNRNSFLSQYRSKFRALSGSTSKPAAPGKPPTAKPPGKKSPPVAPIGPTATMEQCWEALCKANPGLDQTKMEEVWFETLKLNFQTDNNSDITPVQWGQLLEKLTDDVPA